MGDLTYPKILNNDGHLFEVHNELERQRVRSLFTKEEGTIRWLRESIRPGYVFYDIGANIGIYTIVAAKLLGRGGVVYAIEPHVGNAASLLRNLELNDLLPRVRLLTCALAEVDGLMNFNYFSTLPGSSNSQLGGCRGEGGEFTPAAIEIKQARTIDGLNLPPPDLVKIDVDGLELPILGGMQLLLKSDLAFSLQVEMHPHSDPEIVQLMGCFGYHVVERHYTANGKKEIAAGAHPATIVHNAIFRREPA